MLVTDTVLRSIHRVLDPREIRVIFKYLKYIRDLLIVIY
jgi:hypothetical protein